MGHSTAVAPNLTCDHFGSSLLSTFSTHFHLFSLTTCTDSAQEQGTKVDDTTSVNICTPRLSVSMSPSQHMRGNSKWPGAEPSPNKMNLLQFLHSIPSELRADILLKAGPEASARLSITSKDALALIQFDDFLWRLFGEQSFDCEQDFTKVYADPLFQASSHVHHSCSCLYFRYWAARKYTCAVCCEFNEDNSGGFECADKSGVVCGRCCDEMEMPLRIYDV